jgi:hypothetical protein
LKRHSRYYFFSLVIILISCTPRHLPPPIYSGIELSLKEVISEVSGGIDAIKAVVDIDIERGDSAYYHTTASVLIKKPDMLHIRMYNFGMLAGDVVVKGDNVYILYGRIDKRFKAFISELYGTVFWWEDTERGYMYKKDNMYIIRTEGKELYLDSATLLPIKQVVSIGDKEVYITYYRPAREGDFWYPSFMEIRMDIYKFSVEVERFLINPPLGENDLRPFEGFNLPQSSNQG